MTTSVAQVLSRLNQERFQTVCFGSKLTETVEQIGALRLFGLLKDHDQAIWHAHRNIEVIVGLIYKIFFPKLVIVATRHSATSPSWITRLLLNKSNVVIGLTRQAVEYLPADAVVIPHGVDLDRYNPTNRGNASLPGIDNKHLIGVVGRVRELKGQDILLSAAVPLLQANKEWAVVVLGRVKKSERRYQQELVGMAQQAGIEGQVYFVDEVENPADYYRAFDILAVPSLTEGFSMVTLEGMACGCAPIATRGVGIHDALIEHGTTGWLVGPGSIEEMRLKLAQAMADPELVAEIGAAALGATVADRDGHVAASEAFELRLSDLYQSLLD